MQKGSSLWESNNHAFAKMFEDPEFFKELKKRNCEVNLVGGEARQNRAREVVLFSRPMSPPH